MKLKNKILSAILSLTVVASSILPVTLVANAAGRSDPGGGGSSAYTPGKFTYVYLNSDIVMRIGISSITDESNGSDIKSEVGRYGNGTRAIMHEYPLFIRAEHDDGGAGSYTGVPYKKYSSDIDTICNDIETLRNGIESGTEWRRDRNKEFWNENIITYTANTNISAEGKANVYLEDAVLKVKDLYDNGKISDVELRDFWYFYTRMADVAINSKGGTTLGNPSFTTGMSDKLNELFTGYVGAGKSKEYDDAILDDEDRKAMMQSGFLIALYAVYGDIPFNEVTGNNFAKSDSHHLFSNDYTSFVFDRCWTDNLQNYVEPYLLVSTHTWAELRAYHDSMSDNTYEEQSFYPAKGIGWDVIPKLAPNMCPAYTNDVYAADGKTIIHHRFDPRCQDDCAGWSYYEIATGGDTIIKVGYPNAANAQLEVTYNAFLTSGDSDSDYTTESNTFGDNGHVMTDTVYLSGVMSKDEIIKSKISTAVDFNSNLGYFSTTVEKQIYLSSPFEKTKYNLKSLQYRIVDAGGSLNDTNDNPITYGSDSVDVSTTNSISVSGSKFDSAFKNENAKYYVIQRKALSDNGVIAGQYKDDNGVLQYYKVYLSSASGGSMTEVSENLKDADAKGYLDKNSSTNGYNNNGHNKWDFIKNYTGSEHPPLTYCLKIKDRYYPIIKENNIYYLCPRQFVNNLLVQVRADYTATYSKAAVLNNSDDTKKSAVYDEYLLTKNFSTEDMISDKKNKLYSMIDDYSTSVWGDTYNRYNHYYDSTNTRVELKTSYKAKDGTFVYDVGSLFESNYLLGGESQFAHTPERVKYKYYVADAEGHSQLVEEEGMSEALRLVKGQHSIYNSDLLTASKVRAQFRTNIVKTAPLLSCSTSDGKTYLNSRLPVLVKSYDNSMNINSSINQSGLYYTSADYDVENRGSKYDSYVASNPKAYPFSKRTRDTNISGIRRYANEINYWSNYYGETVVGEYNKYDSTNGGNLYYQAVTYKNNVPLYGAETSVGTYAGISSKSKFSGSVNLAADNKGGFSNIRDGDNEKKYMQVDFEKLLTYYNKYLYQKRGNINANLTPSVASWMYSDATANTYATDYAMSYGVINNSSYEGYKADKAEYNKNDGFIRFGTSERVGGGNRILLNSQGVPTALQRIDVDAHVDNREFNSSIFGAFDTTSTIAPQTQSSYDIPIRYTIKSHKTNNISKKAVGSSLTRTPDNKEVSLSYHYGTTETIADMIKYGGTTWAKDKVIIGVYPEVKMWAEGDKSDGQGPGGVTSYDPVVTVGAKQRYIPAMTYTTVKFGDLSTNVNVIGTAVAYDTRAKALAQKLGTVDTQVLYSGSGITGTTTTTMNNDSTIQSYVFDFKGSGMINKVNVKEAWGNKGYSSSKAASRAMEVLLSNFNVSQVNKLGIYNGGSSSDKYKEFEIDTNVNNQTLSIDSSTLSRDVIGYNITMQGGRVTVVNVIAFSAVNSTAYDIGTFKVDGSNVTYSSHRDASSISISNDSVALNAAKTYVNGLTSTTGRNTAANKIKQLLLNMKLIGDNNIVSKAFEWGTGVELPYETVNGVKNYKITSTASAVLATYAGNKYQGSDGLMHDFTVTANHKSYSEDCSVLQIRSYSAKVKTSSAKGTFTEQIPINLGPATPADKNSYFTNGYKGFINVKAQIVAAKDITFADNTTLVKGKELFGSEYKHKLKNGSEIFITSGASKDDLDSAIPDFIIGDVPISEALTG